MHMGKLEGKIVLVTGGSRGIGLAIAQRLGKEGARLVLVARNEAALRRAAKEVPGGALIVRADVTEPRQVERLYKVVGHEMGGLDILINNAGVFTYKPFVSTSLVDWHRNIETNLTALYLCTRGALPLLGRSRSAHLVNILSVSSLHPFVNCSAYTASKFGALGLTRVLREELRPLKIRVTGILPGSTNTRLTDEFGFPICRIDLIQPMDIAEAVLGALTQPPRTTVEEILLMPSQGSVGDTE
jgi:NAD(P)-dependent dehydrogenase (short-subunit alcohol dehydrogenase family)